MTILVENFDDELGRLANFDSYEAYVRDGLRSQYHIDLRAFVTERHWQTSGSEDPADFAVGPLSGFNNWNGLFTIVPAADSVTLTSPSDTPLDIETDFEDTDQVSLVVIDFPINLIDAENSFLELTSNADNDFDAGPVASVAFSDSLSYPAPVDSNDINEVYNLELAWERSSFGDIDLSAVTGVRLIVANQDATNDLSFYTAALRIRPDTWQHFSLDIDTATGQLKAPVPPDGDEAAVPDITLPVLWRTSTLSVEDAPRPIDISLAAIFNPGAKSQAGHLAIYTRENTIDWRTQADLNALTMADLNGMGGQPDFGDSQWDSRTQADLNPFTQADLTGQSQEELSFVPDATSASYIVFRLDWTNANEALTISTAEDTFFSESGLSVLDAHANYLLMVEISEHRGRVHIQKLANNMAVLNTVYDTGYIENDFLFKRIKGRVGLSAELNDGDAYIESMRPSSISYAEYRTSQFASMTPVEGAQLFVDASGDTDLFVGLEPVSETVVLNILRDRSQEFLNQLTQDELNDLSMYELSDSEPLTGETVELHNDTVRSTSGESVRVEVNRYIADTPPGVRTNDIDFNDFANTYLSFDLYHTDLNKYGGLTVELIREAGPVESTLDNSTQGYLDGFSQSDLNSLTQYDLGEAGKDDYRIPLQVGFAFPNQWQHYQISLSAFREIPPGKYRISFTVDTNGEPTTFWLDQIHVYQRTVEWSARALPEYDPWDDYRGKWVNFENLINQVDTGVLFPQRGRVLQVRGRALSQDAYIRRVQIIPKYAELGRFVWTDDDPATTQPTVTATVTLDTLTTYQFEASSPDEIINYHWYFGDGYEGSGQSVFHTYETDGNYTVTVTATNRYGEQGFDQEVINVT